MNSFDRFKNENLQAFFIFLSLQTILLAFIFLFLFLFASEQSKKQDRSLEIQEEFLLILEEQELRSQVFTLAIPEGKVEVLGEFVILNPPIDENL